MRVSDEREIDEHGDSPDSHVVRCMADIAQACDLGQPSVIIMHSQDYAGLPS